MNLNHSHFLRLHGATSIGIRTSFGVPVVSRWGVTFVIVFYSRAAVQVCDCVDEVNWKTGMYLSMRVSFMGVICVREAFLPETR